MQMAFFSVSHLLWTKLPINPEGSLFTGALLRINSTFIAVKNRLRIMDKLTDKTNCSVPLQVKTTHCKNLACLYIQVDR